MKDYLSKQPAEWSGIIQKRAWAVLLCVLVIAGPLAYAEPYGAEDHPLVERFPRAEIVQYQQRGVPEYRLALGAMEKVNAVIAPERESRHKGLLTRITYRIPEGHRSQDVFDSFKQQLAVKEASWLFECKGRQCGSSSQWAYQQFDVSRLYGVDREQAYLAAQVGDSYIALYTTQRGNRQVFAHVDILEPSAQASRVADMSVLLKRQQPLVIPADELQAGSAAVKDLARALTARQPGETWLVGHWDASLPTQQLLDDSLNLAEQLKSYLIEEGVPADTLFTLGVGPLAPGAEPAQASRRVVVIAR